MVRGSQLACQDATWKLTYLVAEVRLVTPRLACLATFLFRCDNMSPPRGMIVFMLFSHEDSTYLATLCIVWSLTVAAHGISTSTPATIRPLDASSQSYVSGDRQSCYRTTPAQLTYWVISKMTLMFQKKRNIRARRCSQHSSSCPQTQRHNLVPRSVHGH
jgi:hypothetical protein